ncbi:MAG: hypothetical protein LBH92_00080 [Bacteroidales bacterium]|jgi:hypothetical protein|nr:hypothetical protein [Bacteroidales bacterium]
MKASFKNIDEIFDYKGLWDIPSKCGLKINQKEEQYIVIVSELYQNNPGTSITQVSCSLAKQICEAYQIPVNEMVYIEHNPEMNSKLSFYDEEFYLVKFDIENENFVKPKWELLSSAKIRDFLNNNDKIIQL